MALMAYVTRLMYAPTKDQWACPAYLLVSSVQLCCSVCTVSVATSVLCFVQTLTDVLVLHCQLCQHLGPVFPCTFDGRSNWSLINFWTWPKIISMIVFPSPISDESSVKSPINLMAEYWQIKSDNWRLHVAICSSLLIHTRDQRHSLRRSERQFTH